MRLHHLTVYVHSAMATLGALWAALQTFGLSPLFFRLSTSGRRSEPERHIDPGTTRCSHTRLPAPLCQFRSSLSPCTRAMRYLHAAHDRPAPPHTMTITPVVHLRARCSRWCEVGQRVRSGVAGQGVMRGGLVQAHREPPRWLAMGCIEAALAAWYSKDPKCPFKFQRDERKVDRGELFNYLERHLRAEIGCLFELREFIGFDTPERLYERVWNGKGVFDFKNSTVRSNFKHKKLENERGALAEHSGFAYRKGSTILRMVAPSLAGNR